MAGHPAAATIVQYILFLPRGAKNRRLELGKKLTGSRRDGIAPAAGRRIDGIQQHPYALLLRESLTQPISTFLAIFRLGPAARFVFFSAARRRTAAIGWLATTDLVGSVLAIPRWSGPHGAVFPITVAARSIGFPFTWRRTAAIHPRAPRRAACRASALAIRAAESLETARPRATEAALVSRAGSPAAEPRAATTWRWTKRRAEFFAAHRAVAVLV